MNRQKTYEIAERADKLLAYCHSPECPDIGTCPGEHEKCKDRLDLDTAIAWIAGKIAYSIILHSQISEAAVIRLDILEEVIRLHGDKYHKLLILLSDLRAVLFSRHTSDERK